jgi:hypothetical protein
MIDTHACMGVRTEELASITMTGLWEKEEPCICLTAWGWG